jgi:hypothetical protein
VLTSLGNEFFDFMHLRLKRYVSVFLQVVDFLLC